MHIFRGDLSDVSARTATLITMYCTHDSWYAGDAADNLPGVPKIGPIKAKALVQEYGSIEQIFANLDAMVRVLIHNHRRKLCHLDGA